MVDGAGNVIVANSDGLTIIESGVPRRFYSGLGMRYLAPDPAGNAVFAVTGYDIYRVTYAGVATKLNATSLPFYAYGLAVDGTGDLILADYSGRTRTNGMRRARSPFWLTTTAYPNYLAGDGSGKVYALFTDYKLHAIAADGTLTPLTAFYLHRPTTIPPDLVFHPTDAPWCVPILVS